MTDQERKVMEMALDALLTCDVDYDYDENPYNTFDAEDVSEAIDALRQALNVDAIDISATCVDETEKREHEPVAWYYADSDVEIHSVALSEDLDDDQKANCIPLYTAPPSKPWVSLTGDEIDDIAAESGFGYINVARAIEAKLKELNHV